MNTVYENQSLTVVFTDINEKDLTAYNLRVDYWKPDNSTSTPDGNVTDITCPYGGHNYQCSIYIEASEGSSILSPWSDAEDFRFMLIDIDTNTPWTTARQAITQRGK